MDKIKRIWNLAYIPTAFFLGALNMWIGETGVGCLFILFATNETINKDQKYEKTKTTNTKDSKGMEGCK